MEVDKWIHLHGELPDYTTLAEMLTGLRNGELDAQTLERFMQPIDPTAILPGIIGFSGRCQNPLLKKNTLYLVQFTATPDERCPYNILVQHINPYADMLRDNDITVKGALVQLIRQLENPDIEEKLSAPRTILDYSFSS